MLVQDLIKKLQKYPKGTKVKFTCSIENGWSMKGSKDGELFIDEDDDNVINLHITGEECEEEDED